MDSKVLMVVQILEIPWRFSSSASSSKYFFHYFRLMRSRADKNKTSRNTWSQVAWARVSGKFWRMGKDFTRNKWAFWVIFFSEELYGKPIRYEGDLFESLGGMSSWIMSNWEKSVWEMKCWVERESAWVGGLRIWRGKTVRSGWVEVEKMMWVEKCVQEWAGEDSGSGSGSGSTSSNIRVLENSANSFLHHLQRRLLWGILFCFFFSFCLFLLLLNGLLPLSSWNSLCGLFLLAPSWMMMPFVYLEVEIFSPI